MIPIKLKLRRVADKVEYSSVKAVSELIEDVKYYVKNMIGCEDPLMYICIYDLTRFLCGHKKSSRETLESVYMLKARYRTKGYQFWVGMCYTCSTVYCHVKV